MGRKTVQQQADSLLLGGKWLPVTACVLFIRAPLEMCVKVLVEGRSALVLAERFGQPSLASERVRADSLVEFFKLLLPLDAGEERKMLLLPTAEWTAMFSSAWRGQDVPGRS